MISWDFFKKLAIWIIYCCLCTYFLFTFKKVFYLDTQYLINVSDSLYHTHRLFIFEKESIQHTFIFNALDSMKYNEYTFYFRPNTEAFMQSKFEYQHKLKILSDEVNYHDFENPDHGLKFLTAFYEHYLKIIELNNDLIKTVSLHPQFYNNYNTVCVFLNKIMDVFMLLMLLFCIFNILLKLKNNIKLHILEITAVFSWLFILYKYFK